MSSVFYYDPIYDILDENLGFHQGHPSNLNHQIQRRAPENQVVHRPLKPRMDLHENSETNTVTATFELPGMKKEDVTIDVHNGRLIVSGETKTSSEYDEHGYAIRERKFGKFSRALQLPQGVQDDEIRAKMDNGVLVVSFPKNSPELTPKKITIS